MRSNRNRPINLNRSKNRILLKIFTPVGLVHIATKPTYSTIYLENGKTYTLRVSGTASAGDTIEFDAKYSITERIEGDTWTDLVSGYTSYGTKLLNLLVDGIEVDWGEYTPTHVYSTTVIGDGGPLGLLIYDIYYPNNSGELTVEIYPHE